MSAAIESVKDWVIRGKKNEAVEAVRAALAAGADPGAIMKDGLIAAMSEVGQKYSSGEFFLPQMMIAARAMTEAITVLKPHLVGAAAAKKGKALVGTVAGDFHDIGKNIVKMMMEGAGYEVVDLGVDVAPEKFVAAVQGEAPRFVLMSALITLTMESMRRTIAKRLAESMYTAPHFYVTVEIDMGASVALREQLLKGENLKISYNDLAVKACARALTRFPMVNASWGGDKILTHGEVHVGIAVAIPDGLITPVVRNADRKSVLAIAAEIKDLAGRARDKKLRPEEYMGSTFTISNLGMFDVEEFTAIINPPDSAILAVGSVRKVPVVAGDAVAVGHRMKVTMSSDHRVVDGAMAAQFLGEVRRLLENPVSLLV